MDITIEHTDLQKYSLIVLTPMYGSMCLGSFTSSMCELTARCVQLGIKMETHFMFNESLVQRARNMLVDHFINRTTATHMIFIDSDIGFKAEDVINMLILQIQNDNYDVITGPYPKKNISWEKIKLAVDKGMADEDPNDLSRFVGDYVFNPLITEPNQQFRLDEPMRISEGGTGFMMIRRETFAKFREAYPHQSYKPDHMRSEHFDGTREIFAYFDCIIDPVSKRYLSEDYMFCQYVTKMGGQIWMCPWMSLTHTGSYIFGGSLTDIAAIAADPTAGQVALAKEKKKKK